MQVGAGRRRNGHNPVFYTLFPFVGVRSNQVGEGMHNFAPQVLHDRVEIVHKLVESEFMEEFVSLQ